MLKFNSTNYFKQDFSFPSPIIRYLMINVDSKTLKKLYKTCKYFYSKLQINIVDELCLDNEEFLTKDDPGLYEINLYHHQLNRVPDRLWLAGNILLGDNINVSKLLSKIVRCDLYEIYLFLDTKFTINDLAFLTQSGTVKYITCETAIYKSHKNDDLAPLEDILSCVLSANSIEFFNVCFVKETMKNLTLLNFHQKLTQFVLGEINQMLDVNLMDHFLKKNLEDKAWAILKFNDENHGRIFKSQIFEKINAWFPEERKPQTFPQTFPS